MATPSSVGAMFTGGTPTFSSSVESPMYSPAATTAARTNLSSTKEQYGSTQAQNKQPSEHKVNNQTSPPSAQRWSNTCTCMHHMPNKARVRHMPNQTEPIPHNERATCMCLDTACAPRQEWGRQQVEPNKYRATSCAYALCVQQGAGKARDQPRLVYIVQQKSNTHVHKHDMCNHAGVRQATSRA